MKSLLLMNERKNLKNMCRRTTPDTQVNVVISRFSQHCEEYD